MNFEKISSLTYDIMIAKADIDFKTDIEKREYVEYLEKQLKEMLK